MTAGDLITAAARAMGYLKAGRTASASELTDALVTLNNLIGLWRTRSLFVYTVGSSRYTFTVPQASYTIGPSGADFTAARPTRIEHANIVLTDVTPEVRVPLEILDDDEWANLRVREIPVTLPTKLYNDGASPNSTLYLWGYPTIANDLELFTWQQLTTAAALTTDLLFPPGYDSACLYSLAELLSAQWNHPLPPQVMLQAQKARAAVTGLNSAPPKLVNDCRLSSGSAQRTTFNYRTRGF